MSITYLDATGRNAQAEHDFQIKLLNLKTRDAVLGAKQRKVSNIIGDIVTAGHDRDNVILKYVRHFDDPAAKSIAELEVGQRRIKAALKKVSDEQRLALKEAAKRIKQYHKRQLTHSAKSFSYTDKDGTRLGQRVTPLERVGLYVPGGKASYPSTVLMTAIPAKVAGVKEIIMVTPAKDGVINDMVLAAAAIAGVDRIFAIGGVQAIAALAYGTRTIPKVDKIVGPGNVYVATAKRLVARDVAVDMEAGPSEILIICDGKVDPDWIALDMLSQAEHDEMAQVILISPDEKFLDQVALSLEKIIPTLERKKIALESIKTHSALILSKDIDHAAEIANQIAPEHLELAVKNPRKLLPKIKHAGAIFLGKYTSEALGDYVAGPSHVLPTSGTARFSSPLGVYDFQKRSSIIQCTAESASTLGKVASVLARGESLTAHARSAEARIKKVTSSSAE